MLTLLLLCSVMGYLFFFYIYGKCRFIQTPFYFAVFIISFIYLFAINQLLELGAYLALGLGIFLGATAIYLNKGKSLGIQKHHFYDVFYLTPLIVIIFSIPANYQFMDWDEFSFWGLSIKIISTANSLYNTNYPTEYNHYPPGQQLFQYFIIKFTSWSEKNALYSHIILGYSALLYILGCFYKATNIKSILFFFTACILMYYFGFAYASVYSDKILAFYFCAALACACVAAKDPGKIILLAFALIALVLIKQIGLLLALLVISVYAISSFPSHLTLTSRSKIPLVNYFYHYRFWVLSLFALLILIYASYKSWTAYVESINANKHYYIPGLLEFLQGERLQMLGAILLEFIKRIQIPTFLVIRDLGFSVLGTSLLFFIASAISVSLCESGKRLRMALIYSVIFLGWIGYIIFHLYAYQVFFGKWEALDLSSFERYAAIYCLAWLLFIFFTLSSDLLRLNSKIATSILTIFCLINIVGLYPKLRWDLKESFVSYNYDILQRINRDKALVNKHVSDKDSVYFISQGASAYDRWAFYYSVYPKMKQFNPWSLCEARDGYACSYKNLEDGLIGSNYLMLSKADNYFWQQVGHLFEAAEYGKESGLYSVEYTNGVVSKLTRVE